MFSFKRKGFISIFVVYPLLLLSVFGAFCLQLSHLGDLRREDLQRDINIRASTVIESEISSYENAHNFNAGNIAFVISNPEKGCREIYARDMRTGWNTKFVLYPDLSYHLAQ